MRWLGSLNLKVTIATAEGYFCDACTWHYKPLWSVGPSVLPSLIASSKRLMALSFFFVRLTGFERDPRCFDFLVVWKEKIAMMIYLSLLLFFIHQSWETFISAQIEFVYTELCCSAQHQDWVNRFFSDDDLEEKENEKLASGILAHLRRIFATKRMEIEMFISFRAEWENWNVHALRWTKAAIGSWRNCLFSSNSCIRKWHNPLFWGSKPKN